MSKKKNKTAPRDRQKAIKKKSGAAVKENLEVKKKTAGICIALGLLLCILTIWIAFANLHATPVMLKSPENAAKTVEAMMDALCAGDYEGVRARLYGNPELGMDQQMESEAGQYILPLYQNSLSYEIVHAPSVEDSGLALCVAVSALDPAGLAEMVEQKMTEEVTEEDALPLTWTQTLAQILPEMYPRMTRTVTLHLSSAQGQWWIMPEEPLMKVISGTME